MTNTWPPPGGQPTPPHPYGSPVPPGHGPVGGGGRGGKAAAVAAGLVATIAATAGITYAATRSSPAETSSSQSSSTEAARPSGAEQDTAKKKLCDTLDVATRGKPGKGGVRLPDGQVNLPVVLRLLTGAAAIQNSLSQAVPNDVASSASDYVDAALTLATAASSDVEVEEIQRLTTESNNAQYAFLDACGIPR